MNRRVILADIIAKRPRRQRGDAKRQEQRANESRQFPGYFKHIIIFIISFFHYKTPHSDLIFIFLYFYIFIFYHPAAEIATPIDRADFSASRSAPRPV